MPIASSEIKNGFKYGMHVFSPARRQLKLDVGYASATSCEVKCSNKLFQKFWKVGAANALKYLKVPMFGATEVRNYRYLELDICRPRNIWRCRGVELE